eukprot:1089440-Prymnesium_polylepis.2
MPLLEFFDLAFDNQPLPQNPTPMIMRAACRNAPPIVRTTATSDFCSGVQPRVLLNDNWLKDVTNNVVLGRIEEVQTMPNGTTRYHLNTGSIISVETTTNHVLRGKYNKMSIFGHIIETTSDI